MSVSDAAKQVVWEVLWNHRSEPMPDGAPVTIGQALDFGIHHQIVRALDRARLIDGAAPESPLHDRKATPTPLDHHRAVTHEWSER